MIEWLMLFWQLHDLCYSWNLSRPSWVEWPTSQCLQTLFHSEGKRCWELLAFRNGYAFFTNHYPECLCVAVSDRQLVLKSTIPSLSSLQEQEAHWFPQEGIVAKQTKYQVGYYAIHRFCAASTSTMVLKLMFDLCQTSYPIWKCKVSKAVFFLSITQQNAIDDTNNRFLNIIE